MKPIINKEGCRVLFVQTLKPPTETRLFDKIYYSLLSKGPALQSFIVGSTLATVCRKNELSPDTQVIPVFKKLQGWGGRLHFQAQYFQILLTIRPQLLVVASPELLVLSILYAGFSGTRVIWDIQENFGLNWQAQVSVISGKLRFLGKYIKIALLKMAGFCDGLILAEAIYKKDFSEVLKPQLVLENKVPSSWNKVESQEIEQYGPFFLFSGVITKESGILKAIYWMDHWVEELPDWRLIICGFCPDWTFYASLQDLVKNRPWIEWDNKNQWVDSINIRNLLLRCSGILMPYIESEANKGKRPTKWFESRWASKPALVQKGGHFCELEGCIGVDFDQYQPEQSAEIVDKMLIIENWPKTDLIEWTFNEGECGDFFCSFLNNLPTPENG